MDHEELTGNIIAAAIQVHRELGPGFLESVYEKALVVELRQMGLQVQTQRDIAILYRGVEVGSHRLDLFVQDLIVVELKAVQNIEPIHFAILKAYLKATQRHHGLLLNFAKVTLDIQRVRSTPLPGFLASPFIPPATTST